MLIKKLTTFDLMMFTKSDKNNKNYYGPHGFETYA